MWKILKIVKKGEYLYALVPNHPNSTKNGYVLEHRVVMENHLGRLLNQTEVVHHKDGNKHNNAIDNLEVLDNKKHSSLHSLRQGRICARVKCPACGKVFCRRWSSMPACKGNKLAFCSRQCNGRFYATRETHKVETAISENILEVFKTFKDNSEETMTMGSVETTRGQAEMPKK